MSGRCSGRSQPSHRSSPMGAGAQVDHNQEETPANLSRLVLDVVDHNPAATPRPSTVLSEMRYQLEPTTIHQPPPPSNGVWDNSTRQMLRISYFWPDRNSCARLGVLHTIFSTLSFSPKICLNFLIIRFSTSVAYFQVYQSDSDYN